MQRNYKKEYSLALKKIAELQELVFAYQSMYDDAVKENQTEPKNGNNAPQIDNSVEDAQYQEVE